VQTKIHKNFNKSVFADEANSILRSCVHCGFCNATCPTYQLLGNELDGPRGRIYLIKQMLETGHSSKDTRLHLDRCLTCRNCETTCPSGVQFSRLLSIGRELSEQQSQRGLPDSFIRRALRLTLPYRNRIRPLVKIAVQLRKVLPASLRRQLPEMPKTHPNIKAQPTRHARTVIMPAGCAQDAFAPDINADCRQVLDRLGITAVEIDNDGCCGAMSEHMTKADEAKSFMKRNIDAWWPYIENGAEAIISTASACGVMIKDYGRLLSSDKDYADKAARVAELCRDISEFLSGQDLSAFINSDSKRVSFHAPCTLQHGQKVTGRVEKLLADAGYDIVDYPDSHLCCGAAGTYSILQHQLSKQLLNNKLTNLQQSEPDIIATANIGCLLHMRSGTDTPVVHWLQLISATMDTQND